MVRVFITQKLFSKKVAFLLMLLFTCTFLSQSILAEDAVDSEAASVINAYKNTDNNIVKRQLLRGISRNTEATGSAVPQWKKDLLLEALQEKNPTVVEAAVHQITTLILPEFNQRLISLYQKAGELFANMYDSRVRISIVIALSKTGVADNNVFNLFQDILVPEKSKFSYVQGDVLQSIKTLDDPKFIPMVEKYGKFMEDAIAKKKAAGEHPMLYQVLVDYSSMCKDIVQTLKR